MNGFESSRPPDWSVMAVERVSVRVRPSLAIHLISPGAALKTFKPVLANVGV